MKNIFLFSLAASMALYAADCNKGEWGNIYSSCSDQYLKDRGAKDTDSVIPLSPIANDGRFTDLQNHAYMWLDRPDYGADSYAGKDWWYYKNLDAGIKPWSWSWLWKDGIRPAAHGPVHVAKDFWLWSNNGSDLTNGWDIAKNPKTANEPSFDEYLSSKFFKSKMSPRDYGVYYLPMNDDDKGSVVLTFQPCSIFGADSSCYRVYAPYNHEDARALGESLNRWAYTKVAEAMHIDSHYPKVWLGRIATKDNQSPFVISGAYILKNTTKYSKDSNTNKRQTKDISTQNWQDFSNYKDLGAKMDDMVYGYKGVFISMDDVDNFENRYKPKIVASFHPAYCKEDVIYKISTRSPALYSKPEQTTAKNYNNGDWNMGIYAAYYESASAEMYCNTKTPDGKAENPVWMDLIGRTDVIINGKTTRYNFTCAPELYGKRIRLQVRHEFKNGEILDRSDNLNWFIKIQGKDKAPSCVNDFHPTGDVYTLSGKDGNPSVASSDYIYNSSAHKGMLTRVSSQDVSYRFDIDKAAEAKYLIIDAVATVPTIRMDNGLINQHGLGVPNGGCSDESKDDFCILKRNLGLSDNARIVAVDQFNGYSSYLCKDYDAYNRCTNRISGEKLKFYLSFSGLNLGTKEFNVIKNFKVYLANSNLATQEIPHDEISLRADKFNLSDKMQLPGVFDDGGFVGFESGKQKSLSDVPSMKNDGSYDLGLPVYVVKTSVGDYRFYDAKSAIGNLDGTKLINTGASFFSGQNPLGFFAKPLELYYSLQDKTLENYYAAKGDKAQNHCRLGDEFDPAVANKADKDGLIACSVPGQSRLIVGTDVPSVKIAYNFDSLGAVNVVVANNEYYGLNLDFILRAFSQTDLKRLNKYCINKSGAKVLVKSLSDLNQCDVLVGNWADVSSAAIELNNDINLALNITNVPKDVELNEVTCRSVAPDKLPSCSTSKPKTGVSFSVGTNNSEFIKTIEAVCDKTFCDKPGSVLGASSSKPLMHELLKQQKSLSALYYKDEHSAELNTSLNLNALAADPNSFIQSMKLNFFKNGSINEFVANMNGANIPVVEATLYFADIKTKEPNVDILPGKQDLLYKDESGQINRFDKTTAECPEFDLSKAAGKIIAKPCYSSAHAGLLGFEKNYRRAKLLSQYNSEINFIDSVPKWQVKLKNTEQSNYIKDVINCIDGIFQCSNFSIEYVR